MVGESAKASALHCHRDLRNSCSLWLAVNVGYKMSEESGSGITCWASSPAALTISRTSLCDRLQLLLVELAPGSAWLRTCVRWGPGRGGFLALHLAGGDIGGCVGTTIWPLWCSGGLMLSGLCIGPVA